LHGFRYYDFNQAHWGNGGNGCHVNTCIMYYNMSCFVNNLKFSFISQLGVVIKFVVCGSICSFYVGRSNNKKWQQNL
jgi:hypothetical protein